MSIIEFNTPSSFYGYLWRETGEGTGDYEQLPYIPPVFKVSHNTETARFSITLISEGTTIANSGRSESRRYYKVGDSPGGSYYWADAHTGLGIYTFYSPFLTLGTSGSAWLYYSKYGKWERDYYTGESTFTCFYHPILKKYYLILGGRHIAEADSPARWVWETIENVENTGGYNVWNSTRVELLNDYINRLFYNVTPETNKIVMTSPAGTQFSTGQESVLSFELRDTLDRVISSTPSVLNVYPGTGWGYTESTNTLRYIQGNARTQAHVEFVDGDDTYEKNFIFTPPGADAYIAGGSSSYGGGQGSFGAGSFGSPESSDNVSSDLPLGSVEGDASATGFYTRYLCNGTTLGIFGDWLWATDLGLQIAKTAISLLYGDPSEAVISLMSYPFNISSLSGVTTRVQDIFWGNFDSNVPSIALTSQAAYIDWGTITLDEYWGNFLDYSPHTKIDLFLPWSTGSVEIDPGECLPGTLRVVTNIDLNKGSCIHNVIGNNGSVIGQYAGQCGKQIPILSSDIASKSAGLVTAAVAIGASAVVSAGIGASAGIKAGADAISPTYSFASKEFGDTGKYFVERTRNTLDFSKEKTSISQAMRTGGKVASTALAAFKTPTHISRNGGFTDGSASLSIQYPYIILSRPYQSIPESYGHHYGYPSNIYAQLSSLVGYTEVGEIHLDGIPATDAELTELDKLLKGGVIL